MDCNTQNSSKLSEEVQLVQLLPPEEPFQSVKMGIAGVAHDLNNLLMAISARLDIIVDSTLEFKSRDRAQSALVAVSKAKALTNQLLKVPRGYSPVMVDLKAVISKLEPFLKQLLGPCIRLENDFDSATCSVRGESTQMERIVINLATNARDAMPNGGTFTIRIRDRAPDFLVLSAVDTGMGMGPHVVAHLFDPFFTTKTEGKLAGLGLSVVYELVKQSGGYIDVQSCPGSGSTFNIYFPRYRDERLGA